MNAVWRTWAARRKDKSFSTISAAAGAHGDHGSAQLTAAHHVTISIGAETFGSAA